MSERQTFDLSKNSLLIELTNEDMSKTVKYNILYVLSEEGASCICYVAEKILSEANRKKVVLKEYYPKKYQSEFKRNPIGGLSFSDENKELYREYLEYIDTIKRIREYVINPKYKEIRKYVCVDDDIEPLYSIINEGHPTVYCENLYIESQYWIKVSDEEDVVLSQVLQTAVSVVEFLEKLHKVEPHWAYVDIKPDDVLIGLNEDGKTRNYSDVLFFDFESNRLFGVYKKGDISITEKYIPNYLKHSDQIDIGTTSENCTYAKAVMSLVEKKDKNRVIKTIDDEKTVIEVIRDFMKCEKPNDGVGKETEQKIKETLEDIRNKLEEDEKENQEGKKQPLYLKIWQSACIILLLLYCIMGYLVYDVFANNSYNTVNFYNEFRLVLLVFLLIFIDVFVIYYYAQKYDYLRVSLRYFKATDSNGKNIRNKDYNTFRLGKSRKDTTFQDQSDLHKKQQEGRHIWWGILVIAITIGGGVLSVIAKALPLFFIVGITVIVIFMWADYLPACKRDFKQYLDFIRYGCKNRNYRNRFFDIYCGGLSEDELKKLDIQKAIFYADEYIASKKGGHEAFELSSPFYCSGNSAICRNMSRIKSVIYEYGYNSKDEWKNIDEILAEKKKKYSNKMQRAGIFDEIKPDKYEKVMMEMEKNQKRVYIQGGKGKTKKINVDLRYQDLHMKHIYKMTYDRIKNVETISNLIIFTLTLLGVVFVGLYKCEGGLLYSRIPENCYLMVIGLIFGTTGVWNICQAFKSKNYVRIEAEAAYKSRFVDSRYGTFTLNELLQRDIAAGYVQPIDIERGTTRYQGAVIGRVNGETESSRNYKIDNYKQLNRPLLHFKELARVRHLTIMVGCCFGIAFSIFVWWLGLYWTLLPILCISVMTYVIFSKFIIPNYEKRRIIKTIEDIIRKSGK